MFLISIHMHVIVTLTHRRVDLIYMVLPTSFIIVVSRVSIVVAFGSVYLVSFPSQFLAQAPAFGNRNFQRVVVS